MLGEIRTRIYNEMWDEAGDRQLLVCPDCRGEADLDVSDITINSDDEFKFGNPDTVVAEDGELMKTCRCYQCYEDRVWQLNQLMEAIAAGKN